jgi:hypothetical protein
LVVFANACSNVSISGTLRKAKHVILLSTSHTILIFPLDLDLPPNYAPELALACRVNAAFTQWTTVIQSAGLAALAVDRVLVLRQWDDTQAGVRSRTTKVLPPLAWLYGSAVVAPIVATSHIVRVRPFADRLVPSLFHAVTLEPK